MLDQLIHRYQDRVTPISRGQISVGHAMKHIPLTAALLLSFLAPGEATACVEPRVPTFNQSVQTASSVFIFRITSIGLTDKTKGSRSSAGRIELVETLKGSPSFDYFTHSAPECGRLNLHVGRYYVVATSQSGKVLNLVPGDKSLLDLTSDVLDFRPPPRGRVYTQMIKKAILGHALTNNVIRELSAHVYAFPPSPAE